MSKKPLFEDSDSEEELKTNKDYAKSYDTWRQKEELNKLKTKYASVSNDSDTSSSSDDDDEENLKNILEKDFLKTLSCLKSKDPRIYDNNVTFFDDTDENKTQKTKVKKKKPLFINDFDREFILKQAECSGSGEENAEVESYTYTEEQKKLKENLQDALKVLDEGDKDDENIFKLREKISPLTDDHYKNWLCGEQSELKDKQEEEELLPLREFWTDPNLDDSEKFLRDYILDKKFVSYKAENEAWSESENDFSEDEKLLEEQSTFEQKYNFRFEEPDEEFIKRYPRTLQDSVRRTDEKRKVKRLEIKERKKQEKVKKMEELKQLQLLKKKEVEDKIKKIQEITGSTNINFKEEDIDSDFDPEVHDIRMQHLFSDEFYQGPEGEQKPEFPDLDEELDIENWDRWHGEKDEEKNTKEDLNCEDEGFNMDCDFESKSFNIQNELIDNSRKKKKRKRKSKFAKLVSQPKPVFDPKNKSFQQYLDEYYKFDCEDVIGDIPCKFKYREVIPNSFGLSIEEILLAKDKELNRWCSLKKAVQYRPEHVEKYDVIAYGKRTNNDELKKKLLPSLFVEETETNKKSEIKRSSVKTDDKTASSVIALESPNKSGEKVTESIQKSQQTMQKTKRKRKNKNNSKEHSQNDKKEKTEHKPNNSKKRKFDEKRNDRNQNTSKKHDNITNARLSAYGISKKKFKKFGNKIHS